MPETNDQTLAWSETRYGLDVDDFSSGLFLATVASRGYSHMRTRQLQIGKVRPAELLSLLGDVSFSSRGDYRMKALIDRPGVLASFEIRADFAHVTAAGADPELLERTVDELVAKLPAQKSPEISTPIAIWSEDGHGSGHMALRELEPERWRDLADGYSSAVREDLEPLMNLRAAPASGRLILWHGEPGTGKTHALRALAHEWRDWCSVHFVADPDRFIGEGMTYMLGVLNVDGFDHPDSKRQKLIVLEDSGELLSMDARQQSGHGLSRLLNLSDGLLGIGTNTITLISTNEPLGRLHPAVHRPGRCLAETEFTALDVDEASEWLAARGSAAIVDGPKTIAQLYAILEGRDQGASRTTVGFG